ncbi:MAG TPA: hypothetical protein VMZ50_04665 [Phycisphaerae bacterium]|nr:hypothetical protein [Phycisphaerae bacterium]
MVAMAILDRLGGVAVGLAGAVVKHAPTPLPNDEALMGQGAHHFADGRDVHREPLRKLWIGRMISAICSDKV